MSVYEYDQEKHIRQEREEAGQREGYPGDRRGAGRGRKYHPADGGRDGNESEIKFNRIE